jgi:tetratricopeptide (TPR) repeat protein
VAGILLVAMRWVGSVGDRPSEEFVNDLRRRGRALLQQTTDKYAIARFLAADAFFPFWVQATREPTSEELALADSDAVQARQMATELQDPDLESASLDALAGTGQALFQWSRVREISHERLAFESSLSFYERLDAHSMAAWASYCMGDLVTADRESANMAARLLPGQAPYPALHLYAWRALTLSMLGRWDESVAIFWRAVDAWHDAGSHAAGYAMRGFAAGLDIGRARGDARLAGVATEAIESIATRFSTDHSNRAWLPYARGESDLASIADLLVARLPSELVERRLSLASDMRDKLSEEALAAGLARAARQNLPLLEAQLLRNRALLRSDSADMRAAIATWERCGAVPQVGRARAELGLITGDPAETEAGLAILKKLGDANYVDRFAARV